MRILIPAVHMRVIEAHGESTYPNEGAGFMLGRAADASILSVEAVLPLENRREAEAQHDRYELAPRDFMWAELEAARRGLDLVGVFHSHPDHPAQPSEFDREHALPNFSYLITSVRGGRAADTRAWRLRDDRTAFDEDGLEIIQDKIVTGGESDG